MELVLLIIGFGTGISLGAVLSWRDDKYRGDIGWAWLILLSAYLGTFISFLIKSLAN